MSRVVVQTFAFTNNPSDWDSFHAKTLVHDGSAAEYRIVDRLGTYYRNTDMEQWVKEELAHAEP